MVLSTRDPKVAALEFVNLIRSTCGKPPLKALPKGERKSGCKCPVARALHAVDRGVDVDSTCIYFRDNKVAQRLRAKYGRHRVNASRDLTPPIAVTRFIERFDEGKYPELELLQG